MNDLHALIPVVAIAATLTAQAATKSFTDGNFTNWTTVVPTNGTTADPDAGGGGSQATTLVPTGGNPDAYLNIRLNIGSNSRVVETFSFDASFTHNPATQGPINFLDYAFDRRRGASNNAGNAQAYGLSIAQSGIHYRIYNADSSQTWETISETGIVASAFVVYQGEADEASSGGFETPDFSATGAPITFGYYRGNSTVGGSAFVEGYLDNFTVTLDVTPVPEPAALGGLFGLAVLLVARRRL